METKILNGRELRDKKALELKKKTETFLRKPALAIVQVGNRSESDAYIRQKIAFGKKTGFEVRHVNFDEAATDALLCEEIAKLNADEKIDGIIVQLPLPARIDARSVIEAIEPGKDVDGLTASSAARLVRGDMTGFVPATTKGIVSLLHYYGIPVEGRKVTVVGRSNLVGRPTALAMLNLNATVTVCHSQTPNLSEETRGADILIVAAGKRSLIGQEHISAGQTVIDVGINPESDDAGARRLYGDTDSKALMGIVGALTPVPGGVGPLTVASLFENVLKAFEENEKSSQGI